MLSVLCRNKVLKVVMAMLLLYGSLPVAYAQTKRFAKRIVKTLASPAFKGRGYEEDGDKTASSFIAKKFRRYHIQPLNNGSYFQDFDLPVNTFPGEVSVKLNGQLLTTAVDYLVDAASPGIHGTFNVLPVKRSDINSIEKLKAVVAKAGSSFILIDNRKAAGESSEEQEFIDAAIGSMKTSPQLDIAGLILYTADKLTWTTLTYRNARPLIIINKAGLNPSSVDSLTADIDNVFVPAYTTRNICGMIKGTSGSDSTLMITAHYDHLGMMGNKIYFPGANDNASGIAMLLRFAHYYSRHQPKYNTVFIAFSGEEIGLLGSGYYVRHPLNDLDKVKFLVNFDLAGTGIEGIKVVNGTVYKSVFDRLTDLNTKFRLLPKVEIRGEACISDHCPFYVKGVPSFFIYTLGGIAAYHDVYDRSKTLPLTEFANYFKLMQKFFAGF